MYVILLTGLCVKNCPFSKQQGSENFYMFFDLFLTLKGVGFCICFQAIGGDGVVLSKISCKTGVRGTGADIFCSSSVS